MRNLEKTQIHDSAKVTDGMRFLTSVSFHDAKLVDVFCGEKYGKKTLSLLVDFKTAEFPPGNGKLYEIELLHAEFVQAPERRKDCFLLSLDCVPSGERTRVRVETEYFVGGEARHEVWEIEFSGVEVMRLK